MRLSGQGSHLPETTPKETQNTPAGTSVSLPCAGLPKADSADASRWAASRLMAGPLTLDKGSHFTRLAEPGTPPSDKLTPRPSEKPSGALRLPRWRPGYKTCGALPGRFQGRKQRLGRGWGAFSLRCELPSVLSDRPHLNAGQVLGLVLALSNSSPKPRGPPSQGQGGSQETSHPGTRPLRDD